MCFTVNVNLIKEELESRYGATLIDPDKYRPSYYYHAFALPDLPVICSGSQDKIQLMKWGLIPSWTKTLDDANIIRFKTFNARAESIQDKPSFSSSFKTKRCIIPVKGFFEWQHVGKDKIPWYIHQAEDEILSLAGLFNNWVDSSTGEVINSFSVVTTDANGLMSEIHNSGKRMPVVLNRKDEAQWIDINTPVSVAFDFLKPSPEELLKAHTVGPLVNDRNSNRNVPEVIEPYQYTKNNLLF